MRKKIILASMTILIICTFLITSCDNSSSISEESNETSTSKEGTKETEETEETQETKEIEGTEETQKIEETEEFSNEDFTIMDNFFIDYTFEIDNANSSSNLDYLEDLLATGSYDLDGDGQEDEIDMVLHSYSSTSEESYVEVNGIKETVEIIMPADKVYIIDLDSQDNYKEIAIYDYGPSADDVLLFYRYDGNEVYKIGQLDRSGIMNGKGKFISWFNLADKFVPQFYSAWEEIDGKEFVSHIYDIKEYIGKNYEVSGQGYFVALDTNPKEDYHKYTRWLQDDIIEFKNTKIKILDILGITADSRLLNWFYVEMEDGQTGLMYFWIGD